MGKALKPENPETECLRVPQNREKLPPSKKLNRSAKTKKNGAPGASRKHPRIEQKSRSTQKKKQPASQPAASQPSQPASLEFLHKAEVGGYKDFTSIIRI